MEILKEDRIQVQTIAKVFGGAAEAIMANFTFSPNFQKVSIIQKIDISEGSQNYKSQN